MRIDLIFFFLFVPALLIAAGVGIYFLTLALLGAWHRWRARREISRWQRAVRPGIQRGTLQPYAMESTVTIAAVNPADSMLRWIAPPHDVEYGSLTLLNATTVNFKAGPSYDGRPVKFEVREFHPDNRRRAELEALSQSGGRK